MSKQHKILIVDDDPDISSLCCEFLNEDGFQAEAIESGYAALDRLSEGSYQILISDIQMPVMDGITLLRETKKRFPEVEVILMTAFGELPSAIEAIRFGAYDYLIKPLSRNNLFNTINRCIEKVDLKMRLDKSQSKLVEQEKLAAVGAVSAWLSHRMRNSLSVLLMCAHYLQGKAGVSGSNDFNEVVSAIVDKVKVLEKTTSELINYSRGYELQTASNNINEILEKSVKSAGLEIQSGKVEIIKELDPNLPQMNCDQRIITEAFENLIVNAIQAIGGKSDQSLTIKTEVLNGDVNNLKSFSKETDPLINFKPGEWIIVSMINTGSEIPPENMEKLFTPFFTTRKQGSGLGLAIVKKIVEQHGGRIVALSEQLNGRNVTTMKMLFPSIHASHQLPIISNEQSSDESTTI